MTTKTEPKRPTRSGFCNRSWPLGDPSHGRCRKDDCPCDCHTTVPVDAHLTDLAAFAAAQTTVGAEA